MSIHPYHTLYEVYLPAGKIFYPVPHPFVLCIDERPPAFPQRLQQALIRLGTSFEGRPELLDKMEPCLPEVLLGLCPTQEQRLGLLHILAQFGWASRCYLDATGPVPKPPGLGIK